MSKTNNEHDTFLRCITEMMDFVSNNFKLDNELTVRDFYDSDLFDGFGYFKTDLDRNDLLKIVCQTMSLKFFVNTYISSTIYFRACCKIGHAYKGRKREKKETTMLYSVMRYYIQMLVDIYGFLYFIDNKKIVDSSTYSFSNGLLTSESDFSKTLNNTFKTVIMLLFDKDNVNNFNRKLKRYFKKLVRMNCDQLVNIGNINHKNVIKFMNSCSEYTHKNIDEVSKLNKTIEKFTEECFNETYKDHTKKLVKMIEGDVEQIINSFNNTKFKEAGLSFDHANTNKFYTNIEQTLLDSNNKFNTKIFQDTYNLLELVVCKKLINE